MANAEATTAYTATTSRDGASATGREAPGITRNNDPDGVVDGGKNSLAAVESDNEGATVGKIEQLQSTCTMKQSQINLRGE